MRHSLRVASGLFLFAPILLTGCGKKAPAQTERKPPKVTVALPVVKTVTDSAEFTGVITPVEFIEIRARVQGYLKKVYFTEGEMVNEGTPLFLIEREPFEANLAAAKATKKQTEAALKLAQANLDRYQKLYDKKDGTVTLEEVQTYEAQRDAAAANILANDAEIEKAEIELGYTGIRAPITGLMGKSMVDVGNLVGGSGDPTLLSTIVQMNPMYVEFDVSEDVVLKYLEKRRKNAGKERKVADLYVGVKNEEGFPHKGEIDFIDNQVDLGTGTALVRGTLPNKSGYLYKGLFARVKVPLDPIKDAILVEEEALGSDLGGKFLLIVNKENIVIQRPVKTGALIDGMRVIRSGLKSNERYITEGLQQARPGLPVEPETVDASSEKEKEVSGEEKTPEDQTPQPEG